MKYCPGCKTNKYKIDFYKASLRGDGLRGYCKKCCSIQNRKLRTYHAIYKRKRYKNDPGFRKTILKRVMLKGKGKWTIYSKVRRAIKKGILIKENCMVCKSDNVQAHHKDYTKPLSVNWLCTIHHRRVHLGEIAV